MLDSATYAVQQARGRRAGSTDHAIRSRQRIDVLERRSPLDALGRTRSEKAWPHSEQQHQSRTGQLKDEMTRRRAPEIPEDPAHRPGLVAESLVILIEHEAIAPAAWAIGAHVFEHANRRDVRAPAAYPQHVVAEQIRIGDDGHASSAQRKPDGSRTVVGADARGDPHLRERRHPRRRRASPSDGEYVRLAIRPERKTVTEHAFAALVPPRGVGGNARPRAPEEGTDAQRVGHRAAAKDVYESCATPHAVEQLASLERAERERGIEDDMYGGRVVERDAVGESLRRPPAEPSGQLIEDGRALRFEHLGREA